MARNIERSIRGGSLLSLTFTTIGQLAAIGRRSGVARVFGVNFSGFVAWWLWRTVYLLKLPRLEKKVRVALDWTLDLVFEKDLVQFQSVSRWATPRADSAAPVPSLAPASSLESVQ
ncbi:MAG: hypothetical protein ACKVOX_17410 [Rhizobacter sp.]